MDFKKKVLTAAAAGALIVSSLAVPAFAATDTITVTGNGSSSNNSASVQSSNTSTLVQNNNADISNHVDNTAKTGDNSASGNTGGDTLILTGDANSTVNISNKANLNQASLSNCNCATTSDVTISGNGSDSANQAKVNTTNSTSAFQDNYAHIGNDVRSTLKTGDNEASGNTASNGGGMTTILTGNANSTTHVDNMANANILSQGSGAASNGSSDTVTVTGNGSGSYNNASLRSEDSATVVQSNSARFWNDVDSFEGTGLNNASGNTGSDVAIGTGDASNTTTVDNLANFNAANLDCACLSDVMAKIGGNGSDSVNSIKANLGNTSSIFQGGQGGGNDTHFSNYLDNFGGTGINDASGNTGPVSGDPVRVFTGNSNADTTVSNTGGVNLVGSGANISLPGGNTLEFSFSLGDLMALFNS